ncbi:MAG: hypothetical protein ACU836_10305 [Gammaproteobacteria bacterium]
MNKSHFLRRIAMSLLLGLIFFSNPVVANENSTDTKSKAGYSVDGRTSASVLAAKRSLEVAKEDEMGLTIFSGLFVIAIIGFFSTKFFGKK